LSDDQIRELVRIGTTAPTSFHLQNWRFIAVRSPEAKARLRPIAAGARGVMMAHGVSKAFADRFMVGGAVVAGILATVIMLGRCGMRVQFI
jgi:nitroreductase